MEFMTVAQVAEHLGVSKQTVYQGWKTWDVTPIRVGGKANGGLRFRRADVARLASAWEVGE